jgi:hypothetical protein
MLFLSTLTYSMTKIPASRLFIIILSFLIISTYNTAQLNEQIKKARKSMNTITEKINDL